MIVNYVVFQGEMMRKASGEEFNSKRKHFMTSCFGTRETLDDTWTVGLE
jgi:hypothetical protein